MDSAIAAGSRWNIPERELGFDKGENNDEINFSPVFVYSHTSLYRGPRYNVVFITIFLTSSAYLENI